MGTVPRLWGLGGRERHSMRYRSKGCRTTMAGQELNSSMTTTYYSTNIDMNISSEIRLIRSANNACTSQSLKLMENPLSDCYGLSGKLRAKPTPQAEKAAPYFSTTALLISMHVHRPIICAYHVHLRWLSRSLPPFLSPEAAIAMLILEIFSATQRLLQDRFTLPRIDRINSRLEQA